ncbi:CLK4-associating serine/arginine rich protein [Sergentomyia squamirostris]
MWHEARKQERKIRGMLVDYRKRAERRQDFYERIRADPTQFLQLHGRKSKIHLDPSVAAAGDSPAIMMPWQGHQDVMIDRFDGRAHLDYIPQVVKNSDDPEEMSAEERQANYERYRILAQNDFLGIVEDKYLHQLYLEEQFGANAALEAEKPMNKKKLGGVTIGYTYEDSETPTPNFTETLMAVTSAPVAAATTDQESSDSELDMDVSIDVSKLDTAQAHELNEYGRNYGMKSNDFYSFLTKDADEADAIRLAKEEEQEKIMYSGRKSRRERRAQREKRMTRRPFSPPSYAAPEEKALKDSDKNENSEDSRSPSPLNSGKITYITSFGGEDELQPHSKISINFNKKDNAAVRIEQSSTLGSLLETGGRPMTYAEKVKENLGKLTAMNNASKSQGSSGGQTTEYIGKPVRYQRTNSVNRSRSRSRGRSRRYSRSRSRSRRYRRRSRSRSLRRRRRSSSSSSSSPHKSRRRRRYSTSSSSSTTSTSSGSRRSVKKKRYSSSSSSTSPEARKQAIVPVIKPPLPVVMPLPTVLPAVPLPEIKPTIIPEIATIPAPPEVPIKRYYGRRREDQTSSSSSDSEVQDRGENRSGNDNSSSRIGGNSSNTIAGKTSATETKGSSGSGSSSKFNNPRDRLKRKMQILLNKQFKADKKAEIEKTERQIQQQQERDDEMRELALRLRRRQRELRHKYGTPSSSRSRSGSQSPTRHDDEEVNSRSRRDRTRSRERSGSHRRSEDRHRHTRNRSRSREERRRSPVRRSRGRHDSRSRYRRSRSDSRSRRDRRPRSRSRGYRRSSSRDHRHSQKSVKKLVDY